MPTSCARWSTGRCREAARTADPWRRSILMEYRQWYEDMERGGRLPAGAVRPRRSGRRTISAPARLAWRQPRRSARAWPRDVAAARARRVPHQSRAAVAPGAGRPSQPAGRWSALLGTYSLQQRRVDLLPPAGVAVQPRTSRSRSSSTSPNTWEDADAVSRLEGVITAMQTHLVDLARGRHRQPAPDRRLHRPRWPRSTPGRRCTTCRSRSPGGGGSRRRCKNGSRRCASGCGPSWACASRLAATRSQRARYFSSEPTARLEAHPSLWPMTSPALALAIGFLGMRKLQPRAGIIRGTSAGGGWPYIYDDWDLSQGKKAVHECWVGTTGAGKTFALNCYLSRSLAHYGIPFDLLEPMGHGRLLAAAFNIEAHSPERPAHPPQSPRPGLPASRRADRARHPAVRDLPAAPAGRRPDRQPAGLAAVAGAVRPLPGQRPDDDDSRRRAAGRGRGRLHSSGLGDTDRIREIAKELAEEIAGLATGSGPYGHFLNGHTTVDFSIAGEAQPRIFTFHEMEEDDVLVAIAYTQVLAALMRTALSDDRPRIIAVDEVYRMMRHPSLLQVPHQRRQDAAHPPQEGHRRRPADARLRLRPAGPPAVRELPHPRHLRPARRRGRVRRRPGLRPLHRPAPPDHRRAAALPAS